MTDYSKMKMPELRKMFPGVKAVNKRDFIAKINELEAAQAEAVEEPEKLGNKLGRTGTVKANLTAKTEEEKEKKGATPAKPAIPATKDEDGNKTPATPAEPAIPVAGRNRRNEKGRERKEEEQLDLIERYKLSSSDYLATVSADENEAKIVVGDKKSNYFKLLHLRRNGATRTLKSSRGMTFKQFTGSVEE